MSRMPRPWRTDGRLRAFDPAWRRVLRSPGGRLAAAASLALLTALALATVLEPHWRHTAGQLDAQRRPDLTGPPSPAWPPPQAQAARVGALLGLARRHGVQVRGLREDAAPAAGDAGSGGVTWRSLALSAEGSYAALRGFAASALAADASLALDSLVLQRADAGQALLRAEFGFALGQAEPPSQNPDPARDARRGSARGPAR